MQWVQDTHPKVGAVTTQQICFRPGNQPLLGIASMSQWLLSSSCPAFLGTGATLPACPPTCLRIFAQDFHVHLQTWVSAQ